MLLIIFITLVLATLVSEDLTCVWAGAMVAEAKIGFAFAAAACLTGIFIGDLLLFLAGRFLGRPILQRAPLKWLVRPIDVERSSEWFRRRGLPVIAISRFIPGTRLPTYFAAGLLDTGFWKFSLYFLLAAAVWTPLLVGLAAVVGGQVIESTLLSGTVWLKLAAAACVVLIIVRLVVRLGSFRGRRLLLASWRRATRWEFWPAWIFYPPVVVYVFYLGLKYRSLTLFTCANPAIDSGGFIGESKSQILEHLNNGHETYPYLVRSTLIDGSLDHDARCGQAQEFMSTHSLSFPVVLKPNVGQRGAGVEIIRNTAQFDSYLLKSKGDVIIQEYVEGLEFGVFYCRYPDSKQGQVFSITRKLFPIVVGDGQRNLEELILGDERSVCMARAYFTANHKRLWETPANGEQIKLVEIGTHCRGSIFLDGIDTKTKEMEAAFDRLARGFQGFYFGRFDVRTPSLEEFQQGHFKVVELNGVTSEATHIYDPKNSLFAAYKVLFEQWRIAFEIGFQNRQRGVQPTSIGTLARLLGQNYFHRGERSGAPLATNICRSTVARASCS